MIKEIINFITKPNHLKFNTKTIFITIYISFGVFTTIWFQNYSFELFNFNERILGIATLHKIDVTARLAIFYKAIYRSIFVFFILNIILNILYYSLKKARREFLVINYLSLFGIFLLLFYVFNQNVIFAIQFTTILIALFIILIIIRLILKNAFNKVDYNFYTWTIISGLSSTILLFAYFSSFISDNFLIVFSLITLSLILTFSISKFKINYNKILYIFRPITLIPLLIFLSQELFLILNQRSINFIHPVYIFSFGIFLFILFSIYTYIKTKPTITSKKSDSLLLRYYIPTFVVSLSFFIFYTPYASSPKEMFEIANQSNSIMNLFHFGKVPVLEFLPTHLVSDLLYGYIYTIFNGYQPDFSFQSYKFLYTALSFIIFYYFLSKITNRYIAFFISFFFPFLSLSLWGVTGAVILLVPIIIYQTYKKPVFINFLLFFLILLVEISWRPDSGFSCLVAMLFGVGLILLAKFKQIKLKNIIISFVIVFTPVLLTIITIALYKKIDVFHNISQILEFYSSSPQARGVVEFATNYDRIFIIQHIIFPFIITVINIYIIFNIKKLLKQNSFLVITILSLSIFYFTNFQRGLTRHSFAEGRDVFLSSFSFLLISLSVYLFNIKHKLFRHSLFVLILTILVLGFKLKEPKNKPNMCSSLEMKMENTPSFIYSNKKIDRENTNTEFEKEHVTEIKSFFDTYLPENSTYFDFSNTPSLYFYTQNEMPIFFIHFLAITNDNLQVQSIENLKKQDIPFVIFSHYPSNWWDKTDGVDNAVRYYKFAEYIYQNYKPYTVCQKYYIWKKTDFNLPKNKYSEKELPNITENFDLIKLPFVWANYDEHSENQQVIKEWTEFIYEDEVYKTKLPENIDKTTGNYILITLKNKTLKTTNKSFLQYKDKNGINGTFNFDILGEQEIEKYLIRISTQHKWYSLKNTGLRIYFENKENCELINVKLLKAE